MGYKKLDQIVTITDTSDNPELNLTLSNRLPAYDGQVLYIQEPEDAPQGRHLGLFSTIILFVSRILGSGFLAISSGMYGDCGQSPFFFLSSWIVASILAYSGMYVYLELGSLIPRSGGTKVFLENIYNKPKMLISVTVSLYSVVSGFTILNILVFGEYILYAFGITPTDYRVRAIGLLFLYITCAIHGLSVHHGIRVQNIIGGLKLFLAGGIIATGVWVILAPSPLSKIELQLSSSEFFPVKTSISFSSFARAVIKGTFAYGGWNSIHTVSNEIIDPTRTLKIAGPVSLGIITITYVVINITYLLVIPDKDFVSSGQLIGAVLFQKVYGERFGRQFLTLISAICTGGNVFVVLYTISRVNQEVFREGYLPFSLLMASNWPLDAPLPALLLSCSLSTLVIVASPGGDVYNYVVSLESYPQQIFVLFCAIGIFVLRRRYPRVVAPIRSTILGTILLIIISLYLIMVPILGESPNPPGLESWVPYPYLGLCCMSLCALYWAFMFKVGPYLGEYELTSELIKQDDGLVIKEWVKVYRGLC